MDTPTTVEELVVTAPTRNNVRYPRWRVLINGDHLPTFEAGTVTKTNARNPATFELEFSLFHSTTYTPKWWRDQTKIEVEIQWGFADGEADPDWKTLISGLVDGKELRTGAGIVRLHGRDYMGALADAKTWKTYVNQTSAEAVQDMVSSLGLTADVDSTSDKVGVYVKEDAQEVATTNSRGRKMIDLVNYLADKEGFDVWAEGKTIHFKRPDEDQVPRPVYYSPPEQTETGVAYAKPGNRVIDFNFTHDLTRSEEIQIVVLSRNTRKGKTVTGKAKKPKRVTAGTASDDARVITIKRPNLTEEEAQRLAESLTKKIAEREYAIDWAAPADFTLTPQHTVEVVGWEDVCDETYFIEEIRFTLDVGSGAVMQVRAKNHPPIEGVQ